MDKRNIMDLFLRPKVVQLFILIDNESYTADICKKIKNDLTYAHGSKIINEMQNYGLLSLEKKGRIQTITLTEKGKELQKLFYPVYKFLKNKKG